LIRILILFNADPDADPDMDLDPACDPDADPYPDLGSKNVEDPFEFGF
jgi:hypothetical protein